MTSTPLGHEPLTYEDLLQIVELIKSSEQFSEFRLKIGEVEIELKRRTSGGAIQPSSVEPQHNPRSAHDSADAAHAGASSTAPRSAANAVAPDAIDEARTDANGGVHAPPAAPTSRNFPPDRARRLRHRPRTHGGYVLPIARTGRASLRQHRTNR